MSKFKEMIEKLKTQGILLLGLGAVAGFVILLSVIRLMERPVKSVCEYILKSEREQLLNKEDRVLPVEVCIAEVKPMTKRIETSGKLRANNSVVVKSEMPGGQAKIKKIHFEQGCAVKKGDLLIEFEDADYKARVASAKGELEMRELDFKRIEQLHNQNFESKKKYDEAKAGLSMAKGKLEEAEAQLEKTKVIAPFEGTAGIIEYSEGATVRNDQELFKLVDETPMKVEFSVPERSVHDIGVGQALEIKVDALKDRAFKGVVQAVDSAIDSDTHSLNIVGSIPNESGDLRQGLFCNVSVITGEQGDVLQVDETAVQLIQDKEYVFVVDKGRAIPAPIIRGYSENGKVEIKSGLRPGMIVITAGQVRGGGEKVKVTNMPDDLVNLSVEKKQGVEKKIEAPLDGDNQDPKPENTVAIDNSEDAIKERDEKADQSVDKKEKAKG
ncbi:MAG: efflux RND transporter periplasmic adaptor subunit [Proteobacteria bacterium]|nr:efflux RND transporter periplasmic adaptor subunit [Pseudomonadota bacterium]